MLPCAPDWPASLRRASFRGVAFFVDKDAIKYGRRVKVHEFPNRDRPFVEDLGEKAIDFSVTAYVASDNALAEKDALVGAMRRGGPGSLVLPTEGALQVMPYACERSFEKDKLGYIAFSLSFHEAGSGVGTFSIPLLQNLVLLAGTSAIGILGADFLSSYNTVGEAPWVMQNAVTALSGWVEKIDDVRATLGAGSPEVADNAASLAYRLELLHRNVETLAVAGRGVLNIGRDTLDLHLPDVASPLVVEISDVMQLFRTSAAAPEHAIEALKELATHRPETFSADEITDNMAPTAAAEQRNEAVLASMVRRQALIELAITMSQATYVTRRAAIQARADLAELFHPELATAAGDVFQALEEVRARAVTSISRGIADLRPTITIEANSSEPSIVWGYRLFADASKGDDLSARNRTRHPAFMPASFEAEAP